MEFARCISMRSFLFGSFSIFQQDLCALVGAARLVSSSPMCRRCIFFDRDGIINRPPDPDRYVASLARFHVFPAFVDALRVATDHGYVAIMITNQRGIALGCMSQETVDEIHASLQAGLVCHGLGLLDIFVCPYDDDFHPWRKPNPGMILDAARIHGLDLSASWVIGDHETDVEAGLRAGCKTILVGREGHESAADYRVEDMSRLPDLLLQVLRS